MVWYGMCGIVMFFLTVQLARLKRAFWGWTEQRLALRAGPDMKTLNLFPASLHQHARKGNSNTARTLGGSASRPHLRHQSEPQHLPTVY